ncbi:MAG: hypothetical protein ACI89W_001753, partial [Gammaproteobacteria bacterium]
NAIACKGLYPHFTQSYGGLAIITALLCILKVYI